MKKMVVMILLGFAQLPAAQAGSQGTISYTGNITGGTCDVTVNGDTPDATISLPSVPVNELNDQKEAGKTTFHFVFSRCAGTLKYVQPYFEAGTTVDTSNYYLKNVGGTATGVELILRSAGGAHIKPGTDTQAGGTAWAYGTDVTSNDYSVAYITDATIGPATAGTVTTTVVYHLEYY